MHVLFTELDRAICSPFQMEEGEKKFEMGYIQLVYKTRGLSNNTCAIPYAARCVASNVHAKNPVTAYFKCTTVFFMHAILIFYEGGVAYSDMEAPRQRSRSPLFFQQKLWNR